MPSDGGQEEEDSDSAPDGGNLLEKYARSATQLDATKFELKHLRNARRNIVIEMIVDEENKQIEWDNMPRALMLNIE